MIQATATLAAQVGVSAASRALGVARSTLYRQRQPAAPVSEKERAPSARALSAEERATVRATLNSERFADQSPREVYATLLDEGTYLCSWRTMYRVLAAHQEVRERRDQLRRPVYEKPELLAIAPHQLWSWDITKLKGPVTWTYYCAIRSPETVERRRKGGKGDNPFTTIVPYRRDATSGGKSHQLLSSRE